MFGVYYLTERRTMFHLSQQLVHLVSLIPSQLKTEYELPAHKLPDWTFLPMVSTPQVLQISSHHSYRLVKTLRSLQVPPYHDIEADSFPLM